MFENRAKDEPPQLCDVCAMKKIKELECEIFHLNNTCFDRKRKIDILEDERQLALSEANRWRDRILSIRCPDSMRQTEEVCARMDSMLFFSMPQDMRDQLTEEVVMQTLLQLFRRITPEAALMKVLNERKAQ